MERKLMMLTITQIMKTGHKMKLVTIGLLLISFSGCSLFLWEDFSVYDYKSFFKNETNDSLKLVMDRDFAGYHIDTLIYPKDEIFLVGSPILDEDDDVLKDELFNLISYNPVYVYNSDDSLLITWKGPPREMPDSINHIFNYNSWNVVFDEEEGEYTLTFSIYESDLNRAE